MDSQLSILATFDDLRRYEAILTDGTAEIGTFDFFRTIYTCNTFHFFS